MVLTFRGQKSYGSGCGVGVLAVGRPAFSYIVHPPTHTPRTPTPRHTHRHTPRHTHLCQRRYKPTSFAEARGLRRCTWTRCFCTTRTVCKTGKGPHSGPQGKQRAEQNKKEKEKRRNNKYHIDMSCSSHTEACNIRNHRWSHLSLLTTCTLTTARTVTTCS